MRPIPGPALRLRGGLGPTQLSRPAVPPAPVTEEVPWLSLGLSGAALLALLPLLLSMPRRAGVTAGAIAVSLLQMAVLDAPPEQALLEGVLALVWSGVITLKEALAGFASEGVVAVGVMSAVAKGVQATGGLAYISRFLLGRPSSRLAAVLRLVLPTMLLSAVLNNTPVCAMLMPVARSWAASLSPAVAPKQLMMPLSFATMLGGTITLIGSSTNLVAAEAARKHDPTSPMGMLGITPVGLVNAAAGAAYMVAAGGSLLPDGKSAPLAPRAAPSSAPSAVAAPPRGVARLWLTLGVLTGTMCVAAASPPLLVPTALSALCVLMRLGCMDLSDAWAAVNGPVLLSIALSFALGKAIEVSGLAASAASSLVAIVAPFGSLALLFAIYAVAIAIGAVISNNAVVVLMFPIVVRMSEASGVPWRAALYTLTMAASASFSTPVSYQTNLMVSRDADYAFADFVRFGLPLQLVCMLATVPTCYLLYK
mmetsp:Transcript_6805/g.20184  ORF Transcript_6805/g.20184 Transcript_6805/m.20184 type:complete len:481 (-) Transcript_6805:151-1593(-)